MTEFLRMSGMYWGVTALDLLDNVDKIDQDEIVEYITRCQCPVSGGISPCEGHDPHILYTLSAVQVRFISLPPLSMKHDEYSIYMRFFLYISRFSASTIV